MYDPEDMVRLSLRIYSKLETNMYACVDGQVIAGTIKTTPSWEWHERTQKQRGQVKVDY